MERKGRLHGLAEDPVGTFHDVTQTLGGEFALSQTGLVSFIRQGAAAWKLLEKQLREDSSVVDDAFLAEATTLAPILWPTKVACVGQNYADHCLEQGIEPPTSPIIFNKFPQTIIGDGAPISYPEVTQKLDYEVELAVIIGRKCRNVAADKASEVIYGYTVANDISARDIQKSDRQWSRAKGCDTFCPLGPCVVTADEIAEPQNLALRSFVNGELRQNSNTNQMIFSIGDLIAWCSSAFTLYPGDVLLTGTPPGVGNYMDPPGLLQPGDTVRVEIDGIGALENPVIKEAEWLKKENLG